MKCFIPNCEHEAKTRGLCSECYKSVQHLHRVGITTSADEIIMPPKALGRPKKLSDAACEKFLSSVLPHDRSVDKNEFLRLIGGSTTILSKKHLAIFNRVYPE